jgi:hypothetical protein
LARQSTQGSNVPLEVDRWVWFQAIFSERGPVSATARNVLGVVFAYTNAKRHSAWPSQTTIALRARLSSRQVKRVLSALEADGWIRRELGGCSGKGWRTTKYFPRLPADQRGDIQVSPRLASNPSDGGDAHMSPANDNQRGDISNGGGDILPRLVGTSECPTNPQSEITIKKSEVSERVVASDPDGKARTDSRSRAQSICFRKRGDFEPESKYTDLLEIAERKLNETTALARKIGFRDRYPLETVEVYVSQVRHAELGIGVAKVVDKMRRNA